MGNDEAYGNNASTSQTTVIELRPERQPENPSSQYPRALVKLHIQQAAFLPETMIARNCFAGLCRVHADQTIATLRASRSG